MLKCLSSLNVPLNHKGCRSTNSSRLFFLFYPLSCLNGICCPKWGLAFGNLIHKMLIIVENFAQPLEKIFSRASQPKLNGAGFIWSTTPEYIFQ